MDNAGRHRECRDTCSADHRVELVVFLEEEIDELGKEYTADCIEDEADKTKAEDEKCFPLEEAFSLHLESNGNAEEDRDNIGKRTLCGFGKVAQNTAFTEQVAEHQEADKGNGHRGNEACNSGNNDREEDLDDLRNFTLCIGHADLSFCFCGHELDDRRLNNRNKRHIGIGSYHDRAEILRMECIGNEDGCRTVCSGDDADGGCILNGEAKENSDAEREIDTELCSTAEKEHFRVGKERTEVDHSADADEEDEREKLVGNAGVIERYDRFDCAAVGQVDEDDTKAHGQEQRGLHLFFDGKIHEDSADEDHDGLLPCKCRKVTKNSFHGISSTSCYYTEHKTFVPFLNNFETLTSEKLQNSP